MPRLRVRAEKIWTADTADANARSLVIADGRIESFDAGAADREWCDLQFYERRLDGVSWEVRRGSAQAGKCWS
jgi:hypothetical protein